MSIKTFYDQFKYNMLKGIIIQHFCVFFSLFSFTLKNDFFICLRCLFMDPSVSFGQFSISFPLFLRVLRAALC